MPAVMIVGAGIGGLCTAIALQKAGIRARVFEAARELLPLGTGILLPPNALEVLRRLDLYDRVAGAGVAIESFELQEAGGKTIRRQRVLHSPGWRDCRPIAIHRGALQRALLGRVAAQRVTLDRVCTGFVEQGKRVAVQFAGQRAAAGELLIGADGIHSAVRRQLYPAAKVRYAGQMCFRGLTALPCPTADSREIWGGGRRFGFMPIAPDQIYWYAALTSPEGCVLQEPDELGFLRAAFAEFPAPVAAVLESTPASTIVRTDLYDLPPMREWGRGRVVLVGDAAHAMTPNLGQGGAQAMEDALILANCVATAATLPAAVAAYQRLRRKKAMRLLRRSRQLGNMAHWENPSLCSLRNRLIRFVPERLFQSALDRMYKIDDQ